MQLFPVPDFATLLVQPDHTVHRLHRRVGEVWELIAGIETARSFLQRRVHRPFASRHQTGTLGALTIARHKSGRTRSHRAALVPVNLQRIAPPGRAPEVSGDDRNPAGNLVYGDDA